MHDCMPSVSHSPSQWCVSYPYHLVAKFSVTAAPTLRTACLLYHSQAAQLSKSKICVPVRRSETTSRGKKRVSAHSMCPAWPLTKATTDAYLYVHPAFTPRACHTLCRLRSCFLIIPLYIITHLVLQPKNKHLILSTIIITLCTPSAQQCVYSIHRLLQVCVTAATAPVTSRTSSHLLQLQYI